MSSDISDLSFQDLWYLWEEPYSMPGWSLSGTNLADRSVDITYSELRKSQQVRDVNKTGNLLWFKQGTDLFKWFCKFNFVCDYIFLKINYIHVKWLHKYVFVCDLTQLALSHIYNKSATDDLQIISAKVSNISKTVIIIT